MSSLVSIPTTVLGPSLVDSEGSVNGNASKQWQLVHNTVHYTGPTGSRTSSNNWGASVLLRYKVREPASSTKLTKCNEWYHGLPPTQKNPPQETRLLFPEQPTYCPVPPSQPLIHAHAFTVLSRGRVI